MSARRIDPGRSDARGGQRARPHPCNALPAQRTLDEAVHVARHNGRSWGEIGIVPGISKQAVRQRYGTRARA
jgi:hypothetical protein